MNMLVALVLGVATDYGVFFVGRYNEARRTGQDQESAYYTSVAKTSHVIMGSGLAISGATLCLSLTKLNYFRTLGPPCFVGMVVAVLGRAHPRSCHAHAGRPYTVVAAIGNHRAPCGAN